MAMPIKMQLKTSLETGVQSKNASILLYTLTICLVSSALIQLTVSDSNIDVIKQACKLGLDFANIGEFKTFIEQFKVIPEERLQLERVSSKCIKQRQAILELEKLIISERVCDYQQIDQMVNYHTKYLRRSRFNIFSAHAVTKKFFTKYAIQVAHTCKRNLIKNLEEGRDLLRGQVESLEQAKEKVFKDRPGLRSNIKLIEEQPDAPATTNVKERSAGEMTLGEYREALTRLKKPEEILTFERGECEKSRQRRVEIAASEVEAFFKPALICLNLASYYSGSVLAIARLANYGYIVVDSELDLKLSDSQLVRDWIVAVQVCEPMLHMRTERLDGKKQVAVVDTCSERVVPVENLVVFEDKLVESDRSKVEEWSRTSEASRRTAQAIMKSAIKKTAKAELVRRLSEDKLSAVQTLKLGLSSISNPTGLMGNIRQRDQLTREASLVLTQRGDIIETEALVENTKVDEKSEQKSLEALVSALNEDCEVECCQLVPEEDEEQAVSFGPVTTLISTVAFFAVMMVFEWIFFIIMTLPARICFRMNFSFDHLLKFPPRVLSWKDANFAHDANRIEEMDEDDFFDYKQLTPEEKHHRDLLTRVFGKPPPMLFRD